MKVLSRELPSFSRKQTYKTPRENFGVVFDVVQLSRALLDSKTFVDSIPTQSPSTILRNYQKMHGANLSIREFVNSNFTLPDPASAPHAAVGMEAPHKEIRSYIEHMWTELTRTPKNEGGYSSLLPLPKRYVVPGGRFRELYYWDTYFTMVGLRESGHLDLIREMMENFVYLIDTHGFIPNGTRTYYLTRSQPPVFALMVELLSEAGDTGALARYLPSMEKEYAYWMRGMRSVEFATGKTDRAEHVVRMPNGELLNRYFDSGKGPREESFAEDVETARHAEHSTDFYNNVRAGAESGWDYSSRWFRDGKTLATIYTTELVPPDLNALLHETERIIASAYGAVGNTSKEREFRIRADKRAEAMRTYLFDEKREWFCDYIHTEKRLSESVSLGGMYPLAAGIASKTQAEKAARTLEAIFMRPGGLVSTNVNTGQQWDAPNGWAPLQYIAVIGLGRYGFNLLAEEIARRFTTAVIESFENTGTLLEKYNVENPKALASGGEYALQDGFGWTNGVVLYFMNRYNITHARGEKNLQEK